MLGLLLRKVSSKAKSLNKIKKSHEVCLRGDDLKKLRNVSSGGVPLQLFKYPEFYLRNAADSVSSTRSPIIRISDKLRILSIGQLNLVASCQKFQPAGKGIISNDIRSYTHVLCKRLSHQEISSDARLFSSPSRKVYFKLVKRDSKGDRQIPGSDYEKPEEPEIPRQPGALANYQEPARQECSQTSGHAYRQQPFDCSYQYDARDSPAVRQHLTQNADSSRAEEQQQQEHRKPPESVECEKSSRDSQPRESPRVESKKLSEERAAADTPAKSEPSKVDKLISYVREYGGSAIKKCKAETAKYMKLSKSRCAEIQHPDLSNVPQSPETRPDPPPPKSDHWSENASKRPKRRCPTSKPEPMVYVPYEASRPETSAEDSTAADCPRGSPKPRARDESHKFSSKTCIPGRRTGTPTSPHIKCVVSFEETDERYAQLPSPAASKREKAFELDDVSDLKPNVSSLKYRLSKCPAVLKAWKVCDYPKPEAEIKTVKLAKDCFLPRRKKWKHYKGSGEWMKQTYPYRLKVFKSKDCLDPRPPTVIEMKRGDRLAADQVKQPKLSPVHRELAKFVNSSCPPKYCSDVDIAKTKKRIMEAGRKRKKKMKRLKGFTRSRSSS